MEEFSAYKDYAKKLIHLNLLEKYLVNDIHNLASAIVQHQEEVCKKAVYLLNADCHLIG